MGNLQVLPSEAGLASGIFIIRTRQPVIIIAGAKPYLAKNRAVFRDYPVKTVFNFWQNKCYRQTES